MRRRRFTTVGGLLEHEVSAGRFVEDRTHASTVLWLLATPRGSCLVSPDAGNRFAQITKIGDGAARLAERYALEAVQPLVDSGAIRDVSVSVSVDGSRMTGEITFRDSEGDGATTLPFLVR